MQTKIKILHLENSAAAAVPVTALLKREMPGVEILLVDRKAAFKKALKEFSPDIILAGHPLSSFNADEALNLLHETEVKIPFIVVTANMYDEFAVEIIKNGADDYILKNKIECLPIAIQKALEKSKCEKEKSAILAGLISNKKRYRTLIENIGDGIMIISEEGKPVYVSSTVKKILGYTEEEMMAMDIFTMAHPDDITGLADTMKQLIANPGVSIQGHTGRLRHKNGSWRWLEATAINLLHDVTINGIVDIFRDVTERKIAEEKIIHLNRLYAFISQINQTIVHVKDKQELFNTVCKIAVNTGKFELAWIGIADEPNGKINLVAEEGAISTDLEAFSNAAYKKNGPVANVLQSGTLHSINNIAKSDLDDRWKQYAIARGFQANIYLPLKKSGKTMAILNLFSGKADFFNQEEIALLRQAADDISFALDVFEKERQRTDAEQKLKYNEAQLTQAQAIAHFGNWEIIFSNGFATWSEEALRIYGIPTDEQQQSQASWLSYIHPDDLDHVLDMINKAKATLSNASFFHRIIRKDGTIRHIHSLAHYELDSKGQAIALYGVAHDVTEIKKSEEALQQSESNLQAIFENTSNGFILINTKGEIKSLNKRANDDSLLNSEEEIETGKNILDLHESKKHNYKEIIARVLAGETINFDRSYTRKNGEIKWFNWTKTPVYNDGRIEGICITSSDITERKNAEDKILHANRLYAFISQINQTIVHVKDEKTLFDEACRIAVEQGKFKMAWIGIPDPTNRKIRLTSSSGETEPDIKKFTDYKYELNGPIDKTLKGQGYFVVNEIQKDPDMVWKEYAAERGFNAVICLDIKKSGKVVGVFIIYSSEINFFNAEEIALLTEATSDISFALDVFETEKHKVQAEEALHESETNLQAIFENTLEGFILTDTEGIIKSFNNKAKDIFLLNSGKEITTGKAIFDFVDESRREAYRNAAPEVLAGKELYFDLSFKRKNGETKWFIFTINRVDIQGKVEGFSITARDITERKEAEELLRNSQSNLKAIIDNTDASIYSLDRDLRYITFNELLQKNLKEIYGLDIKPGDNVYNFLEKLNPEEAREWENTYSVALQGETVKFEKEFNLDNYYSSFSFAIYPIWENKIVIGLSCFAFDITKQKQAENEHRQTELRYRQIVETAQEGIWIIDKNNLTTFVNQKMCDMLGYSREEMIGRTNLSFKSKDEEQNILQRIERRKQGISETHETSFITKSGKNIWTYVSTNAIFDESGKYKGAMAMFSDITEKKRLEKAIESERDQFFEMFLNAPSAIGMLKGTDHVFEMVNKPYLKLIGKKDIIGKPVAEVLPEISEQGFIDILDSVYATGQSYTGTEALVKLDKEGNGELTDAYLNFIYQAYKNDEGKIEGIFFFANDITEQILSRKEIEKSEKFFKGVIENSDDMITIVDAAGNTIYASPAVAKKFGYTYEECLQINIADIVHPDDAVIMQEFVGKIMMNPGVPMECPLIRDKKKDGSYIWVEGTLTNFLETEGINAIVANFRDVTERKKADEESRFQANLLNTIGQAAIATDMDGVINYWNQAAENIYGWTREEAIGKNIIQLTPAETTREQALQIMEDLKNGRTWSGEFSVQRKDGTAFPALVTDSPIYNEHNELSGIIGISSDITEKKKLEELLDKTNRLAAIGSWEIDVVKGTVFWSDITKEIREVDKDFVPQLDIGISYFKEDSDKEIIKRKVKECIKNGTPWDEELEINTFKGNHKWVRTIGEGEFINGKCIRVYGSFQDISARKKAEVEVLKVYEDRNIILESIGDGFYALDKNWVITYWNKEAEFLLGKKREEVIGKNIWDIYPETVQTITYTNYHKAIAEKTIQHYERFNETLQSWAEISAYPSANGLSVFFKDITERKNSDARFKKLNDDLDKHAKELAVSNHELEQFAYVASHDLQEPLRMVTSFLTQIEKKYGNSIDEKGRQYIHFAVDGAKRMRQIILDLLEFSRVGQTEDKQEEVDLNELMDEILSLLRKKIEEKKAVIKTGKLPILKTFRSPMRQVFQNLVNNSLTYHKK
ncbi:MAG: PAS domain S-box protein, partial [Ferruginibacter sp.]